MTAEAAESVWVAERTAWLLPTPPVGTLNQLAPSQWRMMAPMAEAAMVAVAAPSIVSAPLPSTVTAKAEVSVLMMTRSLRLNTPQIAAGGSVTVKAPPEESHRITSSPPVRVTALV